MTRTVVHDKFGNCIYPFFLILLQLCGERGKKTSYFLSKWNLFLEDKKAFVNKTFNLQEKMFLHKIERNLVRILLHDSDIILRKK